MTCSLCNGTLYVPDGGKYIPCECYDGTIARRKLARILGRSGLPKDQQAMTFEAFLPGVGISPTGVYDGQDKYIASRIAARYQAWQKNGKSIAWHIEAAKSVALDFARKPQGNLILLGEPGCGKTHLAAAIANYQIAHNHAVCFAIVPDLLDTLRRTFNPDSSNRFDQVFEAYRTAPLLVLDDLGTQQITPWAEEKLYQLVNHRYNHRLPMVVTSNEIPARIDSRLRSRLFDKGRTVTFEILAGDYRLFGGATDHATVG